MENRILRELMDNLMTGLNYGKDYDSGNFKECRYPYFHTNLCIDWKHQYIHYNHYGSSARKVSLKDLHWIIRVIFKMKPSEFIAEYIPHTQSKYWNR